MRIGITGASGFIGSHLVSALIDGNGNRVIPLERKNKNAAPTPEELKAFVRDKDLIYHLGGVNRGTDEELIDGNVQGTFNLLEAVKAHGSPSTHIVFASSTQVYKLTRVTTPIRETRATEPTILYGVTKKTAEDMIRISGIRHTILRLSNVYGPGCRPYYNSVIATFCDRAIHRLPLLINGDGNQGRDFIFIDDVIRAMVLTGMMDKDSKRNIFNVGSGRVTSLREVIGKIRDSGFKVDVTYRPEENPGDPSYCCDPERFRKWTGWKPRTSLTTGIRNTLKWVRERVAA